MRPLSRMIGLALLLTACAQSEDVTPQQTAEEAPTPVLFDTYIASGSTRAITSMDDAALKETGFGVFATINNAATPNFMSNQEVTYSGTAWTYTPLKYWPGKRKVYDPEVPYTLSFYAYAPYEAGVASPEVPYTATDYPTWGTDLLWATLGNQQIPEPSDKTTLKFNHACVRLGLQVVANYDQTTDGQTKILIDEVKIQDGSGNPYSIDGLYKSGTLDLTSAGNEAPYKPDWSLGTAFALPTTINEENYLNKTLIYSPLQVYGIPNSGQDGNGFTASGTRGVKTIAAQFDALPEGVTTTMKPLQDPAEGAAYYYTLVPDPAYYGKDVTVPITITYHVITLDSSLPTGYSETVATRSATATITNLLAGHIYTLLLRIGLKHIDATCAATVWGDATTENFNIP